MGDHTFGQADRPNRITESARAVLAKISQVKRLPTDDPHTYMSKLRKTKALNSVGLAMHA